VTQRAQQRVQAIVFDLGETLVDETRHWAMVARYAGVPEFTLAGVLGGLIERRESHRSIFGLMQIESVDPNVIGYRIEERDLYPDVVPVLRQLKAAGYRLAVSGNQPDGAAEQTAALNLPLDLVASSSTWGVSKPDAAFFERIAAELDLLPDRVVHVGDRLDNDVIPAQAIGMHAVFLRRGPWGYLHAGWSEMAKVKHKIDHLGGIHRVIEQINAEPT